MPERATVMNRSEKSAEAVVAAGKGRRAEREGESTRHVAWQCKASEARATGAGAGSGAVKPRAKPSAMKHGWRGMTTGSAGRATCWAGAGEREHGRRGNASRPTRAGRRGWTDDEQTGEYLKTRVAATSEAKLLAGTYRPSPVRRVGIPKPGGGSANWGSRP